ncbi:MAG: GWxTD domain-containing protein [Acidobacteria bacterium]|nr:GWxTD domain-containing protein [Acidobacteriota bacterium]
MRIALFSLLCVVAGAAGVDPWLTRIGPAMTAEEKRTYRALATEEEREAFRTVFWRDKRITEAEYGERLRHADNVFGSGKEGSGANTDQGRMYIANGKPSFVHRLPSSRTFVPCEVWQYESLPRTGYRARVQFLFFRKAGIGDLRLYWPQLHSIRDLLVPQPGTRAMFPVNDIVTANDIRDRLKFAPGEEEIVDAAAGVARGVTGTGNSEIISRAVSPSHMLRSDNLAAAVSSRFRPAATGVRVIQFRAGEIPVVDVQLRATAAQSIGLAVEGAGRGTVPLGYAEAKPVLYTQRFFLLPGSYQLKVLVDGRSELVPLVVQDTAQAVGEGFEEVPGEVKIAMLPDPRSADAAESIARQRRGTE